MASLWNSGVHFWSLLSQAVRKHPLPALDHAGQYCYPLTSGRYTSENFPIYGTCVSHVTQLRFPHTVYCRSSERFVSMSWTTPSLPSVGLWPPSKSPQPQQVSLALISVEFRHHPAPLSPLSSSLRFSLPLLTCHGPSPPHWRERV